MAVFRIEKNSDFTIMPNYPFRDMRLSFKGRGLLGTMLTLRDDWDYTLAGLTAISPHGKSYNKWLAEQRPSLLIDIQAKLSEGKGAGYERWAKVFNLKQMAQVIAFLKENGDMDFDELSHRAEAASEKCSVLTEKLKATEARMSEVEELKKQVINYLRTRETFRAYKASGYSKRYLAEHEQEILLHRAAKKHFNDRGLKKLPTVKALQAEYAALLAEKRATYPAYREARAEMKKLLTYRANAEAMLNVDAKADGKQKEHEQR